MKKRLTIIFILMMLLSVPLIGCMNTNAPKSDDDKTEVKENNLIDSEEIEKDIGNVEGDNPAYERGNTLTVAASSLKGVFNPILANDVYDMWVTRGVFDPLVGYDATGAVVANGVASDWKVSKDRLTYTFNIKKGIKFHDGEELTAADVEFTYYAIADPEYDGSRGPVVEDLVGMAAYRTGAVDKIIGIKVIDNYTISFTINEANINKIRDFNYGIMPKHYYAYNSWAEFKSKLKEPVGSGIMKFKTYEPDEYVALETFEGYYKGAAKIDGVIIKIIPEETQPTAIASGSVDLANPAATIETYEMMVGTGIVNVQEFSDNSYRYVGFNLRKDKFADKGVRQALAYGIRMDEYIKNEWKGFAQRVNSPILPNSWAAANPSVLNEYNYNLEKAQLLLAEAGWIKNSEGKLMKDGEAFVIEWTTYSESQWPLNLIAIARNNWGELGIEVNVNVLDFNNVVTKVFDNQDFDVWNMVWSVALDPDPYEIFHSDNMTLGGFNAGGFNNEKSDELIKLAGSEYDQKKRSKYYQEWSKLVNEELPYLFVSSDVKIWGANKRVKNMTLGSYWDWVSNLETIELEY